MSADQAHCRYLQADRNTAPPPCQRPVENDEDNSIIARYSWRKTRRHVPVPVNGRLLYGLSDNRACLAWKPRCHKVQPVKDVSVLIGILIRFPAAMASTPSILFARTALATKSMLNANATVICSFHITYK